MPFPASTTCASSWEFLNVIVSPLHQPLIETVIHNFASFNNTMRPWEDSGV